MIDVERARQTIEGRVHRTPMLTSATLGARLKAELFQKTGSHKVRGALNCIASLSPEQRKHGVVTWSAGNHAQAVAYAAALEGVDCLAMMWESASPLKVEAARGYGATVDLEASNPAVAYDRAMDASEQAGRFFVHPHDDPHVIAGNGTLALEIVEDIPEVTTVVVGVGGGGLVSGIVTALEGRARVVAVEPEQAQAFAAGLAAGHSVPVETNTIADGLAPPFAGELALQICAGRVESVLVTEDEIADGMRFLYGRAKLACEPAGAAAAAAVLAGKVDAGDDVVVVVSGGNVLAQQAAAILVS
ncbi:MAG TPA: pyridoxal-phosphate dependent enzyme [Gaiellaceae bacterium]|nr:pyridoxal-phosphate dependent enzyme [Gaiellaceae bacterium]